MWEPWSERRNESERRADGAWGRGRQELKMKEVAIICIVFDSLQRLAKLYASITFKP